ncbi:MAG: RHS repeat-associated core domain-containing protein [Pseudodesulfovibrio sp.]
MFCDNDKIVTWLYDPFGGIVEDTNPDLRLPIGFAGGLHDRDLGFVRFGWRDYDVRTGRWTAPDPIGEKGGDPDWYGYCLDDPVNGVDPAGLDATAAHSGAGATGADSGSGKADGFWNGVLDWVVPDIYKVGTEKQKKAQELIKGTMKRKLADYRAFADFPDRIVTPIQALGEWNKTRK